MSLKDSIARFDVFRKMPKDLTEPTFCGALGNHRLYNMFKNSIFCLYSHISNVISWGS